MPSDSLFFSLLTHQHLYTIYTNKITRRCCLLPLPIRRKKKGQTFWGGCSRVRKGLVDELSWVGASEDGWLSTPDRSKATISVFIRVCGRRRRPKTRKVFAAALLMRIRQKDFFSSFLRGDCWAQSFNVLVQISWKSIGKEHSFS